MHQPQTHYQTKVHVDVEDQEMYFLKDYCCHIDFGKACLLCTCTLHEYCSVIGLQDPLKVILAKELCRPHAQGE